MKNTDILGGGFAINEWSFNDSPDKEEEVDEQKISSTDTSEQGRNIKLNKVYDGQNEDGYYDEDGMSYENNLMPEDE